MKNEIREYAFTLSVGNPNGYAFVSHLSGYAAFCLHTATPECRF
jgi:hypothetical protein